MSCFSRFANRTEGIDLHFDAAGTNALHRVNGSGRRSRCKVHGLQGKQRQKCGVEVQFMMLTMQALALHHNIGSGWRSRCMADGLQGKQSGAKVWG